MSVYKGSIQQKIDNAEQLQRSGGLCGGIDCSDCPCEDVNCGSVAKRVGLAAEFLAENRQ